MDIPSSCLLYGKDHLERMSPPSVSEAAPCTPPAISAEPEAASSTVCYIENETPASGGLTCPICLDCIEPANLSLVPDCEHQYCATCILHWAAHKESAWCPQCRVPFSQLQTYRALDGSLRDYPAPESLCLLKRTAWFQEYLQAREKGKACAQASSEPSIPQEVLDWQDYSRFYEEYDDDEEVEAYYFSSAAGRARITLGNRRWGENGYVSAGRMQARPVAPARSAKGGKPEKGSQGSTALDSRVPASSPSTPAKAPSTPAAAPAHGRLHATPRHGSSGNAQPGSAGSNGGGGPGSSDGKGSGRRARRNARRAAVDMRTACVFDAD